MMAVQMNFAEEEEQRPWTKSLEKKIMSRSTCCRSVAELCLFREIGRWRVCFPGQAVVGVSSDDLT
jgi:hypothetical protein